MHKKFPDDFFWGAATASYQVEGGIDNNDWAEAARQGKVPVCGAACDHYHRYIQDFDLAKSLGHNAHRFSIEWARIEPQEGVFDDNAIDHYKQVLLALKDRNILPIVTLWHFTVPIWFAESGGFARRDADQVFARYAKYVAEKIGHLCEHVSTMNEPNVWATHSDLYGAWPPFKRAKVLWKPIGKEDGTSEKTGAVASNRNLIEYFKVEMNLIKAHMAAYSAIKEKAPHVQVSVVKHVRVFKGKNIFYKLPAAIGQYFQTDRFMRAVRNHVDEIGLNYYRVTIFGERRTWRRTDMDWVFAPEFTYDALMILARYKKPIFVSEAGIADADDSDRAEYIQKQVEATWRAIQDGADVRGHLYWSFMDNYEWALGFEKRFGLIEINYDTMERKVRPSAYVYKKICETNSVVEYE